MADVKALSTSLLRPVCDQSQFDFNTTDDIKELADIVGQERTLEALEFGTEIEQTGYNLYAIGPPGIGKRTLIQKYLRKIAKDKPSPPDWCYVNNFAAPHKPIALQLPTGLGKQLRQDMKALVEQLRFAIPSIFESSEYNTRMHQIDQDYKDREKQTLKSLQEEAQKDEMTILRTPSGYTIVPTRNGEILSIQEIEELSEVDQGILLSVLDAFVKRHRFEAMVRH